MVAYGCAVAGIALPHMIGMTHTQALVLFFVGIAFLFGAVVLSISIWFDDHRKHPLPNIRVGAIELEAIERKAIEQKHLRDLGLDDDD